MHDDLHRHVGKFYGKYSGLVVDNKDDDFLGRLKVTVSSVLGQGTTVTARPCFPAAHFFVPDVDDRVWIEFEGGDVRYPLWVGVWWAKGKAPDDAQASPPDNRVIRTPSGHTIELMDKDGEERVVIRHKGSAAVTLDKDGGVLIADKGGSQFALDAQNSKAEWKEQHGNTVTMDETGVTITQASSQVTIQMTGNSVQVTAPKIVLGGSASVAIGADAVEPAVLGQSFAALWSIFAKHTHVSTMGPTSPPVPPPPDLAAANALSKVVKVL